MNSCSFPPIFTNETEGQIAGKNSTRVLMLGMFFGCWRCFGCWGCFWMLGMFLGVGDVFWMFWMFFDVDDLDVF